MNRHKHADLIHAWAEGATIQYMDDEAWVTVDTPMFKYDTEYRIKPEGGEWWENIPKHGVLCWVDHYSRNARQHIGLVTDYKLYDVQPYRGDGWKAKYATPLTNEEIERFKR